VSDSPFDRLNPAVQYHVVNSLGWRSLRPTQLAAIGPILEGRDALILAPTAGGKTEAAFIPVLSRMVSERSSGLTVLYVCPIKALLNNLEPRLSHYAGLVGRRVAVWHGDISDSRKQEIRRDPPDVLLTTPESLEGMLISTRTDRQALFGALRTVIVDELHAFAGDDRGWHLRAVLDRVARYGQAPPQRIGLSATVGNPETLLKWFSRSADAMIVGDPAPPKGGELTVDFVGSLEGAAKVVSRLYRGDKRLVFCDSRSKVEELASQLVAAGVRTFVSHSSLSVADRRAAEQAFAEERDCVIVATSTLELGIDVGDLDHVIQIDAPGTVSSLLQRMGRTGRRPGSTRNCTFLTTDDEGLLLALALCRLLAEGYTEPIDAPADPWHIVAQQAMATVLEAGAEGIGLAEWQARVVDQFPELPATEIHQLCQNLIDTDILNVQEQLVGFGATGEKFYGRRHFLELCASFTTPPVLRVRFGARDLGFVDPVSVLGREGPAVLSLAGRAWRVTALDWRQRIAWVEPASGEAKTRWQGTSRALSGKVAAAMKQVLKKDPVGCNTSSRADVRLEQLREQFDFLTEDTTEIVVDESGEAEWWTFAGGAANAVLANVIRPGMTARSDDLSVHLPGTDLPSRHRLIEVLETWVPNASTISAYAEELKFATCLPKSLLSSCVSARLFDTVGARRALVTGPVICHSG
jgi:ATP-dependent Lhr-like helicase